MLTDRTARKGNPVILTTTNAIQGADVERHLGIVFGDSVVGVNLFRDFFASIRDIVGGRSRSYEKELGNARDTAMNALVAQAQAMGADAVIGLDIDYEAIGKGGSLLMVSASGTAVVFRRGAAGGVAPPPQGAPWGR